MTYEDKKKILSLDPNQIYEEYFISGDVWLFKNQFNSDEHYDSDDWVEITTDSDKAFSMIDLGKAEASFIMNLE